MSEEIQEKKAAPFVYLPVDEKLQLVDQSAFKFASPETMVIISPPLMGKTLSAVNQEKFIIVDFYRETNYFPFCRNKVSAYEPPEKETYVYLHDGTIITRKFYDIVMELKRANQMQTYKKLREALDMNLPVEKKEKIFKAMKKLINEMPFPVGVFDTLTAIQLMNFRACLHMYNSMVEPDKRKKDIRKVDNYNGTRYTRPNFFGILDFVESNACPFVLYYAHIKDKKSVYNKDIEDLNTVDINLEGLVSSSYTNRMGAVGIFNRTDEGCFLDFVKRIESDLGGRPAHLWNKVIKIADITESPDQLPRRYWDKIYVDLNFSN